MPKCKKKEYAEGECRHTVVISFTLPEDLATALMQYVNQSLIPRSKVITEAIREYLERRGVLPPTEVAPEITQEN